MSWNWKWLIPGYGFYQAYKNVADDGYDFGDLTLGYYGFDRTNSKPQSASNIALNTINNHGLDQAGNIEVNSADPTSSASNVINYDPNKSAMENMLGYARANNSASAYNAYLQTLHNTEMSNSALSRAIADAEANGISKYQLFQSGNAAASTPASGSSLANSYENAMNRRESWNEKELAAIVKIVSSTISSAFQLLK